MSNAMRAFGIFISAALTIFGAALAVLLFVVNIQTSFSHYVLYGGLIVAIFAAVLNGVETYVLIKYSFAEGLAPWSRRVARLNAHITALVAREKLSEELGQERKKKGSESLRCTLSMTSATVQLCVAIGLALLGAVSQLILILIVIQDAWSFDTTVVLVIWVLLSFAMIVWVAPLFALIALRRVARMHGRLDVYHTP